MGFHFLDPLGGLGKPKSLHPLQSLYGPYIIYSLLRTSKVTPKPKSRHPFLAGTELATSRGPPVQAGLCSLPQ